MIHDRSAGIWRCEVCDGYCRRFDGGPMTCADEKCPGHRSGGLLPQDVDKRMCDDPLTTI